MFKILDEVYLPSFVNGEAITAFDTAESKGFLIS